MDKPGPVPQGDYLPARRHGSLIYTSGMTPRVNGTLMFSGSVKKDEPVENFRAAVRIASDNALEAVLELLAENESISAVLSLTVYVAAEEGFTAHSRLADFASQFLIEKLGTVGSSSRCAVGVATLPSGAPVEIQLIAAV